VSASEGNTPVRRAPAALTDQQVERDFSDVALFNSHGLDLYLIPGNRFEPVASAVGLLRELTYRQQLAGSGQSHDLDSRDLFYDHFLLVERRTGELAGSARLQFVPKKEMDGHPPVGWTPEGHQSYLEHVYPGIKAAHAQQGNHLEIGRVALAPRFQRLPHPLMCLFRGGIQVAISSGYYSIGGLVSYNHFAYDDRVNKQFLSSLISTPFSDTDQTPPQPRHPLRGVEQLKESKRLTTIQALEQQIKKELDPNFRLPILLRQYINLIGARVVNLSLALDFNKITEILMSADLSKMPTERLQHFTGLEHQPVYKQFSWYRGLDAKPSAVRIEREVY